MTKRVDIERYYKMLEKIEQSEKAYKESAPAFLMSVKHNLYVSNLNRQCRRTRK